MDTFVSTKIAAEAPRRRRVTADERERMIAAGVIRDDERIELIDGDLLVMAAKGNRHELVRDALLHHFMDNRPRTVRVASEAPIRLSEIDVPEPDFTLYPSTRKLTELDGTHVLLVVEVADWSLGYDLGIKSLLYAGLGVVEYWVVDANRLVTHVHRDPRDGIYQSIAEFPTDGTLAPLRVPELTFALADLGLGWAETDGSPA